MSDAPDDETTEPPEIRVRQARLDDREAIVGFTRNTWPELGEDYIPRVFEEWVEADGPDQRTFVATVDGRPVAVCQGVFLTDHEAWGQGLRVDPDYRGRGVGRRILGATLGWAAERGGTVCRNMVFSWNGPGLGGSRAAGFEPATEFRWLEPDPDPDADPDLAVVEEPAVAWRAFHRSDAFRELGGLGLDLSESWALAEVSRRRLAAAERAFAVADDERARGMTYRTRTYERTGEDGTEETWAEYGVAAYEDHTTLASLAAAVARDAAAEGASRARVLIPETPRHVSDAAYARVAFSEDPDFVLACDLTRY